MDLPLVPVDEIPQPFRTKVETVAGLGGDVRFYRFAANAPHIVDFYWGDFYRDLFFAGSLPIRLKELVRLRLAALNGCPFCQVGDRASAMEHGVTEEEIDAVFGQGTSDFAPLEQAAIDAATSMSNDDPDAVVDPEVMEVLQRELTPAQLAELFVVAGVLTGMARMLTATGFIDRACPVPATRTRE